MQPAEPARRSLIPPVIVAPAAPQSALVIGAAVAATVIVLYVGQSLLIPMALAALLAFALEPLARRLRRLGLGRITSTVVVVTLTLSMIGGFGYVVGTQVYRLAERIPLYKSNIEQKIRSARSGESTQSVLDKASTALRELQEEIEEAPAGDQPKTAGASRRREIVAVQMQEAEQSPLQFARELLKPIVAPVGMVGLVIVLLIIMLLEHADLRDRMIRLFGGRDLTLTTNAMSEAGERVSRYLLMQLLVNVSYGLPIGIGLYLIGVPNAPLWGLLAMVLRFIPYIGPLIAMVFPMTLSLAVDPGWSMLLWTIGLFVLVEVISNNIVEPWLYGSSTGISAVAIIVAAIFWTTLWGPAGLLLSTPLTVCLVVLGRYVPQLRFLDVLLGRSPALSESERFYQRMLADDVFEGLEVAIGNVSGNETGRPAHEVVLPALQLAESDRRRDALPRDRAEAVGANTLQVLAQLRELGDDVSVAAAGEAPTAPVTWRAGAVLCVGRRSSLDAAAAQLLAQVLGQRGIVARTPPGGTLSMDAVEQMFVEDPPELVVVVHLSECAVAQAQHACKRIKRHSNAAVLLAFFDAAADLTVPPSTASLHAQGICAGTTRSFDETLEWIDERARAAIALPMMAAPDVPREQERIDALIASGLLDTEPESRFDAITASLREAFDVPIALISLVDGQRQFWKSASDPQSLCGARESPRSTSICGHVVSANEVMVVPDTYLDARFANNPFLRERGIRFYAGAPLRAANGLAIGTVCVLGKTPRQVSRSERHLLEMTASRVMQEIAEVGRSGVRLNRWWQQWRVERPSIQLRCRCTADCRSVSHQNSRAISSQ